jgi:hypothetical protein
MKTKKAVAKRKYTKKVKPELPVSSPIKIIRTESGQLSLLLSAELIEAIKNAHKKPAKAKRDKDHPFFKIQDKSINFFISVLDKYGLNKQIDLYSKDILWLAFQHEISKYNIPPLLRVLEQRNLVKIDYGKKGSLKVAGSFTILSDPRKKLDNAS